MTFFSARISKFSIFVVNGVRVVGKSVTRPYTTTRHVKSLYPTPLLLVQKHKIMADGSSTANQHLLVRPPYNWWDAHPRYIPPHSAEASITSPPSLPSSMIIDFLHPAYDFPANILFSLPAVDAPMGSSRPGVHHGTALSACMIITANRGGRLTTSVTPPSATDLGLPTFSWDTVLTGPRYYFHPKGQDDTLAPPYPVVPDFRSWRFPHGQLPVEWVDPVV